MTKLPEPAYVTIRDYKEVNYYTHAQMLQFRRDALEEAAQYAESMGMLTAPEIRKLKDET